MLVILFIPFIPLLAFLLIGGSVVTLIWYSNLTEEQKREANERALRRFGKRFKDLTEEEQEKIKDESEK